MTGLSRLWPRSMAGQLGLLMLAGALATHGIGVLFLQRWGVLVHPLSFEQVLERHAIAHTVVRDTARETGAAVLEAMAQPASRVWSDRLPEVAPHPMKTEELRLEAALRQRLGLAAATPVWVQLERIDGGPARDRLLALRNFTALQLRISVGLPDGGWLNSRQLPTGGYEWWRLLRFSLPVSILPVLLIGWWFVRRILRPLDALVAATGRLGRGEQVPPLPAQGPWEARELTRAFNAMQERIFRFVQDRTRMLAAVGHDFRTPITSLRLQAALVEDAALREDMVDTLRDMGAMVEETLDFARDDAAGEDTAAIDLQALIATVARRWQGGGARVEVLPMSPAETQGTYRGRRLALRRALSNLIDNAVRHGGGARVRLVRCGAAWRIDVEDDGPGIAPHLLQAVFEPFVRSPAAQGESGDGGLGLGLSIARTCAQAHGGEVRLDNRPEGGLRASLWLP